MSDNALIAVPATLAEADTGTGRPGEGFAPGNGLEPDPEFKPGNGERPGLTPLLRLVLYTDGTMTDLIETLVREPIDMIKLGHRTRAASTPTSTSADGAALGLDAGEALIERRIVLLGRRSGRRYLYADASIAAARLAPAMRHALMTTDEPFGRLCRTHCLEVFKETPVCAVGPSPRGSVELRIARGLPVHARRYRMFVRGRPLAIISEVFAPALWEQASSWIAPALPSRVDPSRTAMATSAGAAAGTAAGTAASTASGTAAAALTFWL